MKKGEPKYSYMEFVHASSMSKWHIRKLTDKGQKLGGGVDTPPLCGRKYDDGTIINGWDLKVEISKSHDDHTCSICLEGFNGS